MPLGWTRVCGPFQQEEVSEETFSLLTLKKKELSDHLRQGNKTGWVLGHFAEVFEPGQTFPPATKYKNPKRD